MAEYIEREALIKTMLETPFTMSMCLTVEECNGINKEREILARIFEVLPAADVVPVVRCKDCRFYEANKDPADGYGWCRNSVAGLTDRNENFFCAVAVRVEEIE